MKTGLNGVSRYSPIRPLLVILSGPSGVGKDAALSRMRKMGLPFYYTVTATTRPCRPAEVDNVDYQFVSYARFQDMVARGELLEWANVYGNYYGVPRQQVVEALGTGQDVILKVDVQGAATIKRTIPEALFLFLAPPSMEELVIRLKQRKTEMVNDLEIRIRRAKEEMDSLVLFDYVVVNDLLEEAVEQIRAIVVAEKCRVIPRMVRV
ncbi:MAG: guanylate kinase [Chloroflexi bacterium]|nr:guanylate kinase [Chloroflexota bacterium]